jgi:hypothetical protein
MFAIDPCCGFGKKEWFSVEQVVNASEVGSSGFFDFTKMLSRNFMKQAF